MIILYRFYKLLLFQLQDVRRLRRQRVQRRHHGQQQPPGAEPRRHAVHRVRHVRGRDDHAADRQHRVPVLQRHRPGGRRAPRPVRRHGGTAGRQTEAHRRPTGPGGRLGRALRSQLRGRAPAAARAEKRRDAHAHIAHAVRSRVRRRTRAQMNAPRITI